MVIYQEFILILVINISINKTMSTAYTIGARVEHPGFGKGVIVTVEDEYYVIWFKSAQATKIVNKNFEELQLLEANADMPLEGNITLSDIEDALERILNRRLEADNAASPLALRW